MLEAGTQVQTHAPVMMALGPEELAEAENRIARLAVILPPARDAAELVLRPDFQNSNHATDK